MWFLHSCNLCPFIWQTWKLQEAFFSPFKHRLITATLPDRMMSSAYLVKAYGLISKLVHYYLCSRSLNIRKFRHAWVGQSDFLPKPVTEHWITTASRYPNQKLLNGSFRFWMYKFMTGDKIINFEWCFQLVLIMSIGMNIRWHIWPLYWHI